VTAVLGLLAVVIIAAAPAEAGTLAGLNPRQRWRRVVVHESASQGRWEVAGELEVGGTSETEAALGLLTEWAPQEGRSVYHHLRTAYVTLLYPHNSIEFAGNHTLEQRQSQWCVGRCCATKRTAWTIYAEFGTSEEAADFAEYLTQTLVPYLQQAHSACVDSRVGAWPILEGFYRNAKRRCEGVGRAAQTGIYCDCKLSAMI
jgi:hypothetical protein